MLFVEKSRGADCLPKFELGKPKTGGRKKGTPNKSNPFAAALDKYKFSPEDALVKLCADESVEPATRLRGITEMLKYIHPQKRAVDVTATVETNQTIDPKVSDAILNISNNLGLNDSESASGEDKA